MGLGDKVSGRIKKAAGDLTDNESLHRKGRAEERKGEAKEELEQAREEALDRRRLALHLEQHAVRVVAHEAAEPELLGQPEDVRAEPDALDGALHAGAHAAAGRERGAHRCGRRRISDRTRP